MRKYVLLIAALLVVSLVASTVYAAPKTVLGQLLGFWAKRSEKVLAVKRDRNNDAYVIVLAGEEVKAYKFPAKGPMVEVKPLVKYDMEKLKKVSLVGDAGWAHKLFMEWSEVQDKDPLVRAITFELLDDGTAQFVVHVYTSVSEYRGGWPVTIGPWKFSSDKVDRQADPLEQTWTEELEGEGGETAATEEARPAASAARAEREERREANEEGGERRRERRRREREE